VHHAGVDEAHGARRFLPRDLKHVDLGVADPRVVWASAARASSEYSSSYAASAACGPPSVFPEHGDRSSTWLAANEDADPWIELTFPETHARAVLVLETCGPGVVREIRDVERGDVLWSSEPAPIDRQGARALSVTVDRTLTRVRVRVAPYHVGREYHEIDAVALLTEPIDAIRRRPPSLGPVRHRRYAPSEIAGVDLRIDPRILWAVTARASSEWSSSYSAGKAIGPPNVFPRGGDFHGTWLSDSSDRDAWIELEFPPCDRAHGLVVLETCGVGSVYKVTDERGEVVWQHKRERFGRAARLLWVPLDTTPSKLRLWVSSAEDDYREIDAVGLVTVESIEALIAAQPERRPPAHQRHTPDEVAAIDLGNDRRILWASRARASSAWSDGYAAKKATGPPTIFPRAGDIQGAWLAQSGDDAAWIELEFPSCSRAYGFIALETCGAGALYKATDGDATLWLAAPEEIEARTARLLYVPLDRTPSKLRLWVSDAVSDYREIDAVALVTAPFEELFQPAPPPPPPGAPETGFTTLEGVLLGGPFVHATLRTHAGGRAANHGGPLRLRLASDDEVPLEAGRTIVYGAPRTRVRGTWEEIVEKAPMLAAAFSGEPPSGEVVIEGRCLEDEVRVEVAGTAQGRRAPQGGFRESARDVPERFEAVAISRTPLGSTTFAENGVSDFDASARRLPRRRPHPLRGWSIATSALAVLALAGFVAHAARTNLWIAAEGLLGLSAIALALFSGALALDLFSRTRWIPDFVRGDVRDRRVAFTSPGWTVIAGVLLVGGLALVLAPVVFIVNGAAEAGLDYVLTVGAGWALIRLVSLLRAQRSTIWTALRVTSVPASDREVGERGRFTGVIASGDFERIETFTEKHEHLGTETYQDEHGNTQTRDRWRSWSERSVADSRPSEIVLRLDDGTLVRGTGGVRATDMAMSYDGDGGGYARFVGEHGEGDEATLVGTVKQADGPIVIDATHLVLGDIRVLRRRLAVQLVIIVVLSEMVIAGLVYLFRDFL
jgi:hypothetical protein